MAFFVRKRGHRCGGTYLDGTVVAVVAWCCGLPLLLFVAVAGGVAVLVTVHLLLVVDGGCCSGVGVCCCCWFPVVGRWLC